MRTLVVCALGWLKKVGVGLTLAILTLGAGSHGSMAKSTPPTEQLLEAIAALEARVAVLERKLERSESAVSQQADEGSQPRPLLVSLTGESLQPAPMLVSPVTERVVSHEGAGWSGLYWGTSFGYGSANSKSNYSNVFQSQDRRRSDERQLDNDSEISFTTNTDAFDFMQVANGRSKGSNWNDGALADLYLGANIHLSPRILAGVQVEGSLAEMTFASVVNKETGTRENSSDFRTTRTVNGNTTIDTFSDEESETFSNEFNGQNRLELDWTVSVLGRAGWLASPTTFLYGLGGWTYGHFEADELLFGAGKVRDFGAHGITIGGGVEQKLSPKWSLKAEYRYTNFGKSSFSKKSSSTDESLGSGSDSSSSVEPCCTSFRSETSTTTSTNTFNQSSSGYFDNQMHVGRVGVTRYFNLGD